MASHLEQALDDEQQPGATERFRHRPQPCPKHCPIFECVVGEGCSEECKNLEMVRGMICDLCVHEASCTKKRRMALLDLEYFNHIKKIQTEETSSRIEEVKAQHRHFELAYKDLKEQAIGVGTFSFGKRVTIEQQGLYFRNKIELYREVMNILDISYKIDVKLDDIQQESGISIKTLFYLSVVIALVVVYVGVVIL